MREVGINIASFGGLAVLSPNIAGLIARALGYDWVAGMPFRTIFPPRLWTGPEMRYWENGWVPVYPREWWKGFVSKDPYNPRPQNLFFRNPARSMETTLQWLAEFPKIRIVTSEIDGDDGLWAWEKRVGRGRVLFELTWKSGCTLDQLEQELSLGDREPFLVFDIKHVAETPDDYNIAFCSKKYGMSLTKTSSLGNPLELIGRFLPHVALFDIQWWDQRELNLVLQGKAQGLLGEMIAVIKRTNIPVRAEIRTLSPREIAYSFTLFTRIRDFFRL